MVYNQLINVKFHTAVQHTAAKWRCMQPTDKAIKNYRPYYAFGVYALLYSLLSLLPAPDHATLVKYHLSNTGLRWLELTVILPSIFTWFMAFFAYERLHRYSHLIRDTKDGRHIGTITNGFGVIAFIQPLAAIISTILTILGHHNSGFISTQVILRNYILLLVPLIAFIIIQKGTRGLTEYIKSRPSRLASQFLIVLFILIGVAYTYLVTKNTAGPQVGTDATKAYYLPDILILQTLVVPYLYMWFIGMLAVTELLLYNKKIRGIIYKRSWAYITRGFICVIAASIIIQYVTSLSGRLNRLHLNGLLAVVYALLILQAVGYVVIALGAKKLQKIEEV
jgi:hypothetical protein